MIQFFEDFKKQYPSVALAMGMLGMTYEEYCDRYNREVLRWVYDPLRTCTANSTMPLHSQWRAWYSNSTVQKEI